MDYVHKPLAPESEFRRGQRRTVFSVLVVLLSTWFLLWAIQGVPIYCALAFPCPKPEARVFPALLFGGLMIVPLVIIILTSFGRTRRLNRGLVNGSFVVMVLLALIGMAATLFSGGFGIGF
ncbi:hypothetical protein [Pseudarthrobacter albicanus]|uniref:hypothetical protein n=1 Tax=Pseudarthrobacter albicanus TaxID=2823873 RepID=UPI001FEB390C|nr:hypothetical protein [Pseudarthrobacter albicanus]